MIKIELWNEEVSGLIVPAETGVVWTNQTGGTYCAQPVLEGFFVPFSQGDLIGEDKDPLLDWWWRTKGVSDDDTWGREIDADAISRLLDLIGFGGILKPDPAYVGDWGEAWVPVIINCSPEVEGAFNLVPLLGGLSGRSAILTYPNSD